MKRLLNIYLGYKNAVEGEALAKKKESYKELVTRLFYGDEPDIQDRILFNYFCTPELWDVWCTLDFEKVAVNENTKNLAVSMASAYVYGGFFDPEKLAANEFISVFSDAGHNLLNHLTEGMIGTNIKTFKWLLKACKDRMLCEDNGFRPVIAPIDEAALVDITKSVGDIGIRNYRFNFAHLKKQRGQRDYTAIMHRWWESMDVKSLKKIQTAMCVEMGRMEHCLELLASKAGNSAYRFDVLKRLAKIKNTPPVSLGAMVCIPGSFVGADLCNLLDYIHNNVLDMRYISGVPTEDDLKVRILGVLLNSDKELYEKGLEAHRLLALKCIKCVETVVILRGIATTA